MIASASPAKLVEQRLVRGAGRTTMLRNLRMAAAFCVVAAAGSLCLFATSAVAAKHRSATPSGKHRTVISTSKHRSGTPAGKHRSGTATGKHRSSTPTAKPVIPTDQTPTNKNDCLGVAQALYEQAETLSKRTKQAIPREFTRAASNLDKSCGEEDFDKARISIDWMNTCLENFTKDYTLGFCSRSKSYFCAIDPKSDGCLQSQ